MKSRRILALALTSILTAQFLVAFIAPANAACSSGGRNSQRPTLSISSSSQVVTVGSAITTVTITNSNVSNCALSGPFTISPTLPAGLTFNGGTGTPSSATISGTPTATITKTTFTISAPYKVGTATQTPRTITFQLTVNPISTLSLINNFPMVNPATGLVIPAGLAGDTLKFVATGLTAPLTVTFGSHAPVAATATGNANEYSVVVPTGLTLGSMFVRITDSTGKTQDATFQLWKNRSEPYVMPAGHLNVTINDLRVILDNIKMGEAHAARTASTTLSAGAETTTLVYPYDVTSVTRCLEAVDVLNAGTQTFGPTGLSNSYVWTQIDPFGVRQVDGQCNNISGVKAEAAQTTLFTGAATSPNVAYSPVDSAADTAGWGAADQQFTRLSAATNHPTSIFGLNDVQKAYQNPTNNVIDPSPRIISNIISEQTANNPAAVASAVEASSILYGADSYQTENSINATTRNVTSVLDIPNITADYNVSAGYDSWFTLFGQFFDHGLDLIPKAGATVLIPLQQEDPLYSTSPGAPNFMVLTRGAGANGESINETTPYVDQSQTYGSHPSQNFFLREYNFNYSTDGATATSPKITSTGRLIEGSDVSYAGQSLPADWYNNATVGGTLNFPTGGVETSNGGLATWQTIKAQALLLGFNLTDYDIRSIPVVATDQYGKFIPGPHGYPMMLFANGTSKTYKWIEGSGAAPILTDQAPWKAVSSGRAFVNDTAAAAVPFKGSTKLTADADSIMNSPSAAPSATTYDNETLNAHLVAGDGRVNENIGLSAIHIAFHSEHNLIVKDISDLLAKSPEVTAEFASEWTGDRLYQAARFITEMEYQHMVYDEFIRRIAPELQPFVTYEPNNNPAISAEFASAVYRVGHSMLNETIARSNPGTFYDPNNNQDVSLLTAFTNPAQARLTRPAFINSATYSGSTITYTVRAFEPMPKVGQIVSVNDMDVAGFNITDGVVAAVSGSTFTVTSQYRANSATPVAVVAPSPTTSASKIAATDGSKYATVAISDPGTAGYSYTPGAAAAAIAQGMAAQRGNEIDEFVTDSVRNNLLGLPLDLASLNITRGRDTGIPTLNQFRSQFSSSLPVYTSWADFMLNLRHFESISNFVAAYGTHDSLKSFPLATVTSATASGTAHSVTYTYTIPTDLVSGAPVTEIMPGNVVTVSGFSTLNVVNAVVDSVTPTTFTVSTAFVVAPNVTQGFAATDPTFGSTLSPTALAFSVDKLENAVPSAPNATRLPTVTDSRKLGTAITTAALDVTITDAVTSSAKTYTYTASNTYSPGQFVTISGILNQPAGTSSCFNLVNAYVVAADVTSFTVQKSASSLVSLPACTGYVAAGARTSGGKATYVSNGDASTPTPPTDAIDFFRGTNSWSSKETGINNIDLWMGGLAENPAKQPLTPPMLGTTFQAVFVKQALVLQNGDRFYYLGRLMGQNLGEEIPGQKLADIMRRNTPSASSYTPTANTGLLGINSPNFGVADCSWSPNGDVPLTSACASSTMVSTGAGTTHVGLDNVVLFGRQSSTTGITLIGGAGDDSVQGTSGNDYLDGGISGGDLIYGYGGNDIISGGPGEDLLNGGSGDDVINAGTSQAGDIADGGSGNDWIDCGNCNGFAISFIGETGNDFVQGGTNHDFILEGGEGDDWVEGGDGLDIMWGDNGNTSNFLNQSSKISGGNDVLNPQNGIGIVSGDGGDDIFLMGTGLDQPFGSYGFDWADYEYATRHDNGPGVRANIFSDLSGNFAAINNARSTEVLIEFEGLSGSPGDDLLYGGIGTADQTISKSGNNAANFGSKGSNQLSLPGAVTLLIGSYVFGVGIGPNAIVEASTIVVSSNTTKVTLSTPNTATVPGPITITTWPLQVPSLVSGLTELVSGTPGWTKYSSVIPGATNWSGGGILLGGDGNDVLYPSTGEDVIHGSAYLHTCFKVVNSPSKTPSQAMLNAMDVTCGNGRGFSNMTLANPFMHAGVVLPGDLQIIREILPTSTLVTRIVATGTTATYTANNNYYVGEVITVDNLANGATSLNTYNLANSVVTAVTPTTFTVASTKAAIDTVVTAGRAMATDTLDLSGGVATTLAGGGITTAVGGISGASTDFTFTPITKLPAGTTFGCTIKDKVGGGVITAYDVELVAFTDGIFGQIQKCGSSTPAVVAPALAASVTTMNAYVGFAITPIVITNVGADAIFTSDVLPDGLVFTTISGTEAQITGTPTSKARNVGGGGNTTRYGVTATNIAGSKTTNVTIVIDNAPIKPTLAPITPATRTVSANGVITPAIVPSNSGGVSTYTIAPDLATSGITGLTFNTTTGSFSGTPRVSASTTVAFTITATNFSGTSSTNFTLTVEPAVAPVITASSAAQTVAAGAAITPVTVSYTGGVPNSYAITSATAGAPALTINQSTGIVSGTIGTRVTAGVYTYQITATNNNAPSGSQTSNALAFVLTVTGAGTSSAPVITYPVTPRVVTAGSVVIPIAFANTGGTPSTYAIVAVTSGAPTLTINQTTGAVTGTIGSNVAAGDYVYEVTASNAVGSSVATFTLTVNPPNTTGVPVISLSSASQRVAAGSSLVSVSVSYTGGTPTSYAISPAVVSGLTFDTTSGILSGAVSSSVLAGTYAYQITATNVVGTSTPVTFTLTVTRAGQIHNFIIATVPPATLTTASVLPLTVSGTTGTTPVTYTTDNTTVCKISGAKLSASGAGTCVVTATQVVAGTSVVATATYTFAGTAQANLRISNKTKTAKTGSALSIITSGGSGTGAVTFTLDPTSAATCKLVPTRSGADLTSSAAGTCTVIASKAASFIYLPVVSGPTTFTFTG